MRGKKERLGKKRPPGGVDDDVRGRKRGHLLEVGTHSDFFPIIIKSDQN